MPSATTELIARAALAWLDKRPFSKESRARRKAKRAARKSGQAVPVEAVEVPMDIQAFVVQTIMAVVRHGLTAGGFTAVVSSEQSMAQIAGVVALAVGGVWSLYRKWQAAKAKPAA